MKKTRSTDNQIVNILKQAKQGVPIADLCRRAQCRPKYLLQLTLKVWRHGYLFDFAFKRT